jgi:hypothetical protein
MNRFFGAVLAAVFVIGLSTQTRAADDKDTKAILDKAIKALGGEEKLAKAKAATWKTKGKISFGENDNAFKGDVTVQGLDHCRQEFEGDLGKFVMVLAGDKGWMAFGDNTTPLDKDPLDGAKRDIYLQMIPVTLLPLKDKDFKIEAAGEEKVDGKPAVGLKVTAPDKKDFTIHFDKESGLPVKLAAKITDFGGAEVAQETTYSDYKEFDGIKKATKVVIQRDGKKFLEQQISDFKVLDKVDPKTFAEPK